jgi:uncharacterized membrane protein
MNRIIVNPYIFITDRSHSGSRWFQLVLHTLLKYAMTLSYDFNIIRFIRNTIYSGQVDIITWVLGK